jgi:predicted metal-dependent hydrolase
LKPPPVRPRKRPASSPAAPLRCPQLSLFDAAVEGVDPAVVAVAMTPPAAAGEVPVDSLPLVPPFAHPLADSRIQLRGRTVAYALRRARRRSIGLLVGLDGLRVSAPRWATRRDIETALNDKADWIVRKLGEQQERAVRLQAAHVDWCAGATLPYLGAHLRVQLGPQANDAEAAVQSEGGPAVLHLDLPPEASPAEIQAAVIGWLKRQALALFAQRCDHFAPLLAVRHTQLRLSTAQTRWGSAHASGTIRLNWRLIHFALPVIDYVVAHELAHLREMNHSPRFWELVATVVPDVDAAQRVLKETVLPVWR